MVSQDVIRVRKAPWGRKRYYAPLPILSVLLLVTVVAAPSLLRTTFNVYDDGALSISASVQNVVHPGGPTGKFVGLLTVTNLHPFAINLTSGSAVITAGSGTVGSFSPDNFQITIPLKTPLLVPAGATVRVSFSGSFTGSVLGLSATGSSFLVQPDLQWNEMHSLTDIVGPFAYTTAKVCTVSTGSVFTNGWGSVCS